MSRYLLAPLIFVLAAASTGCWSSSSPDPEQPAAEEEGEAKELAPADTSSKSSDDKPQAELSRIAKRLYQSKMYSVSRESLQSLGNLGTPGAYRTFAEIKLADSYFFNGEHSESAKRYEEFAKNYPSSAEVPYAKLQAARSYLSLARGTGRDRKPLETALTLFDDLVQRYPDTDYGAIAQQSRIPVIKELAAYDQGIIDFYQKVGNAEAVADRTRAFDAQWGPRLRQATPSETGAAEKRLLPLLPLERSRSSQEGVAANVSEGSEKGSSSNVLVKHPSGTITVRQITCRQGPQPYAILEVEKIPDALTQLGSYEAAPTDTGVLTMSGLDLRSPQGEFDCFGTKDLRITPKGDLEVQTSAGMVITALEAPPRLLLSRLP